MIMKLKLPALLLACSLLLFPTCTPDPCLPVTTDPSANKAEFLGLWYEIASIPQFFNIGCRCTTAEYIDNGTDITVINSCRLGGNIIGIDNRIEGNAFAPDPNDFTKLKVKFPTAPVAGDYWILEFGPQGSYMLVGDGERNTLFILSRTPTLNQGTYNRLVRKAEDMCFDVDELKKTDQNNCP